MADGTFRDEIVPVEVAARGKTTVVTDDEGPAKFDEARLRALKPAFGTAGYPGATITAGNASSISDGAAAVLLVSEAERATLNLRPMARVVGAATHSQDPEWFTTAPVYAIRKLLDRVGWGVAQVDLFEINEAFAVVAMVAARELSIPAEKLNIDGGAVAMGHPIGCSGTRILVTLLHALKRTGGRRGVASLCIGGGEAVAVAVAAA
jgi:acetyl-CoA C-acetyltransferase